MNIKTLLCLVLVFGCTKKPEGPSAEELARLEKEKTEQAAKEAAEKEKYRLEFEERQKKKNEEKLKQMQVEYEEFEKRNHGYKKWIQVEQHKTPPTAPDAKNFKDFIKKLNQEIKATGLPFHDLNFSKEDVKDSIPVPEADYFDNPLGEKKSIVLLSPKGSTKTPIVIKNSEGAADGPCAFTGSVFSSDFLVKAINNGSVLVNSADGKKDVWITPSFFNSVSIYKKNQKKVLEQILLPNEGAFVIHVDEKKPTVYVQFTYMGGNYKEYADYPGVKSLSPYLVLKMSATSFEFIDDPAIYKHAADYRGRTPYEDGKGHYRQNDNYKFQFSLDVCT